MAYQPKSYRKFLATSVSAAMVATTFGAVVPADVQQADAAESFSDVSNDHWASESIQRLANEGIINGYPDGTYGPTEDISRGQVAELLVNAFDLEVDENAESSFEDLNDDSYSTPFAEAVAEAGYIEGRENNTEFAASRDLTREQMATILVRAFELEPVEDTEANVNDLDNAHESHKENIEILSQHGITETEDGNFRPKETVNRAQFATFLDRALDVQEPLAISEVNALTDDGHVLEVNFNRPYTEDIDSSDVRISEADSGERKGVEDVELSSDRQSAEITLYDNTSEDAPAEIERLTNYDLQIGDLETTFARPQYWNYDDDGAHVESVDKENREIEVLDKTLEVPEDMDFNFQAALGQQVNVWFDGDDVVEDIEIVSEAVTDAVEVDGDEISTINENGDTESYELTEDTEFIEEYGTDDEDDKVGAEDIEANYDGNEYDYAKVILDDNGDVARVYAYTMAPEDSFAVEEVDGNVAIGYGGEEVDLEDYTIVKDGQGISIDDIEQDDFIMFNEDAHEDGLAVVYNDTVTGEIDSVYKDSFDLEGENYDYVDGAQYLDEDNNKETLNEDGAESLQEGGEVEAYFNARGEIILVKGTEGTVEDEYTAAYTTASIEAYQDNLNNDRMEIEVATKDGEELYDIGVDDLDEFVVQQNGDDLEFEDGDDAPSGDFEIDSFEVRAADGTDFPTSSFDVVAVGENDDGDEFEEVIYEVRDNDMLVGLSTNEDNELQGLKFFETDENGVDVEYDDSYAAGKSLGNSTTVVGLEETLADGEYPDAEDVSFQNWEQIQEDGTDLDDASVYYDDEDNATHLFVEDFEAGETSDETALIKRLDVNTDNEIDRLVALVDGEEVTYDVDSLDEDAAAEGDIVNLVVNDNNDEVTEIQQLSDADVDGEIVSGTIATDGVSVSDDTVEFEDGTVVELESNGGVYDSTDADADDYSVESLRDLEEGDYVRAALVDEGSRFADVIALSNEPEGVTANLSFEEVTATSETGVSEIKLSFSEEADVDGDSFTVTNDSGDDISVTEGTYEDATDSTTGSYAYTGSTVSVYVYGYNESEDGNPLDIDFSANNFFNDSVNFTDSTVTVDVYNQNEVTE
ncbi:hypothetical protein J2S78_000282 [Salibacterium salarium]|uniref:S-layer homology domain-containing protein n=1 Tax=Salibacterium salarium TaxID=284579 RepID=UPI0027824A5F|nr:S-layer homology domain-containing protein [Salibacterium salarium]MDQ0297874.1 hypothetical protein [Salibacterium salarium]